MIVGRWLRQHCWPWTAIGQAYRIGFMHGVHAGARGVSEHVQQLAQKATIEEQHQADFASPRAPEVRDERSRWN